MNGELATSVANLGFATASAAYLLWWVTKRLNSKLQRIVDELSEANKTLTLVTDKLDEILRREEKILEELLELRGGTKR